MQNRIKIDFAINMPAKIFGWLHLTLGAPGFQGHFGPIFSTEVAEDRSVRGPKCTWVESKRTEMAEDRSVQGPNCTATSVLVPKWPRTEVAEDRSDCTPELLSWGEYWPGEYVQGICPWGNARIPILRPIRNCLSHPTVQNYPSPILYPTVLACQSHGMIEINKKSDQTKLKKKVFN